MANPFANVSADFIQSAQAVEDGAYRNMMNQRAAQESTRIDEAKAAARMQLSRNPYAPQDMYGAVTDSSGFIPGIEKVAQPAAPAPAAQPATQPTRAAPRKAGLDPAQGGELEPVSIGSLHRTTGAGNVVPYAFNEYHGSPSGANQLVGMYAPEESFVGRQQYYDLPASAVKAYNANIGNIKSYMKSDTAGKLNTYAKRLGMDANILHAIALQESAGGKVTDDSVQGASGALQIMPNTYRDVISRLPTLTKDKRVLDMVSELPTDWKKATADDKLKAGALYTKLLSLVGAKGNKGNPVSAANIFASYFGGEKHINSDKLPWVADGNGRYIPDYVAMTTGYYNTMNPAAQASMLATDGARPGSVQTAQAQIGTEQQQAGIDPSGTYQQAGEAPAQVAQAPQAPEEPGITTFQTVPRGGMPQNLQNLITRRYRNGVLAEAMSNTGAFGEYDRLSQENTALDAQIYTQLAELGASELINHHAPQRLMAVMSKFTGDNTQVKLRSDGKLDYYVNGTKVSGKDGLTASQLAAKVKNTVSDTLRAQSLSSATTAAQQHVDLAKENIKAQASLARAGIAGQYNVAAAQAHGRASAAGNANNVKTVGTLPNGQLVVAQNGQYFAISPGQDQEIDGTMVQGQPTFTPIAGLYGFNNVVTN